MEKQLRELTNELGDLLTDEDLTDEKLQEASEGLLPRLYDTLNKFLPSEGERLGK